MTSGWASRFLGWDCSLSPLEGSSNLSVTQVTEFYGGVFFFFFYFLLLFDSIARQVVLILRNLIF